MSKRPNTPHEQMTAYDNAGESYVVDVWCKGVRFMNAGVYAHSETWLRVENERRDGEAVYVSMKHIQRLIIRKL